MAAMEPSAANDASAGAATSKKQLSFWRRHLNVTNILSTVFVAYMSYSFYILYHVAVPTIPKVARPEDGLPPLWASAPTATGLRLYLGMSPSQPNRGGQQQPPLLSRTTNDSIALMSIGGLPYSWDLGKPIGGDLMLDFQILRLGTQRRARADDHHEPTTISLDTEPAPAETYTTKGHGKVAGLRVVCARNEDGKISNACLDAAKQWGERHPASAPGSATDPGLSSAGNSASAAAAMGASVVTKGVIPSLASWFTSLLSGATAYSGGVDVSALVVYESRGRAARKIAKSILGGQGVTMSAAVGWDGVMPDPRLPVQAKLPILAASSEAESTSSSATGWIANFSSAFNPAQVVSGSAPLVSSVRYQQPKKIRFLWMDCFNFLYGNDTSSSMDSAEAFARRLGVDMIEFWKSVGKEVDDDGNLIGAGTGAGSGGGKPSIVEPANGELAPHWVGQLDLKLIMDTEVFPRDSSLIPPQIRSFIRVDPQRKGYLPLLAANPVRPLREKHVVLNASVSSVPLQLRLDAVSIGTWQLFSVLDQSLTTQQNLGATDKDTDDVIRLVAETPLWLLGMTFVVSIVHLLFDILAMKNDISFWSEAKSLKGISIKSLSTQLVSQLIITLYLAEEGSSLLVLVPQAGYTAVIGWKMLKAAGVQWRRTRFIIPTPYYDSKLAATAAESKTNEYDAEAMSYMGRLLYPLVLGFAAYSLVYKQFSGWYDWALTTAVSAVYSFGFILMTPQLWINYKLKSVAHMPWRVLGYRFFNTIIDDLFAAIIKMPLMHRISVFRDDVIFVIYMVQRRMYPVDSSRPAEGYEVDGENEDGGAPGGAAVDADSKKTQ